jgi:hypothetical protein
MCGGLEEGRPLEFGNNGSGGDGRERSRYTRDAHSWRMKPRHEGGTRIGGGARGRQRQEQQQIPCGNDRKKSKGYGYERAVAKIRAKVWVESWKVRVGVKLELASRASVVAAVNL